MLVRTPAASAAAGGEPPGNMRYRAHPGRAASGPVTLKPMMATRVRGAQPAGDPTLGVQNPGAAACPKAVGIARESHGRRPELAYHLLTFMHGGGPDPAEETSLHE